MAALTWTVIGASSVVALIAIIQQQFHATVFGLQKFEQYFVDRGSSTIGNPDYVGTFLVLAVVLSAFLAVFERERRSRLLAGAALVATLLALVSTLTRGAWIAVLVGAVVGLVLMWRSPDAAEHRNRALVVAGICVLVVAFSFATTDSKMLSGRFSVPSGVPGTETAEGAADALSAGRLGLWRSALGITAERPLFGTGPGAFDLGWYRHAIKPSSAGGTGLTATDPHSLPLYILATLGIAGLLAWAIATVWVLWLAFRRALRLGRDQTKSLGSGSVYYIAWFVAALSLQVALLVAALSPAVLAYAWLSFGLLLRPDAREVKDERLGAAGRTACAVVGFVLALAIIGVSGLTFRAESALSVASVNEDALDSAGSAARAVRWNVDVQQAYYYLRGTQQNALLQTGAPGADAELKSLVSELSEEGDAHPYEVYYPAQRVKVLLSAFDTPGGTEYAREAVAAADDALAIMPPDLTTRVNKALALSKLERYGEMASTLADYWENETVSAYPGILYAQALALTGKAEEADAVFARLRTRFPADTASIDAAQEQVSQSGQ